MTMIIFRVVSFDVGGGGNVGCHLSYRRRVGFTKGKKYPGALGGMQSAFLASNDELRRFRGFP